MQLVRLAIVALLLLSGTGCTSPSAPGSDDFAEEPTGTIVFTWNSAIASYQTTRVNPDGSGFARVPIPYTYTDHPEISPDGKTLAFLEGADVILMDLATRDWLDITYDHKRSWASWSPDGKRVVSVRSNADVVGSQELRVTEADRNGERTITPPLSADDGFLTQPTFFPSGDSLLYVINSPQGNIWLAYAYRDARPPRPFIAPWGGRSQSIALSRDGHRLAAAGFGTGTESDPIDDHTLRISTRWGGPVLSADFAPNWAGGLSFSPDGKFLVVTVTRPQSATRWLEVLEVSTLRRRRITPDQDNGFAYNPKWGP